MTHTFRTGLQFEQVKDLRQTTWPSNVQYYDFGGAPDYALFRDPSSQGANYTTQGVWAEDQLTIGSRVTLDLGVRFDRMHAVSPDLNAINFKLEETGATIPGSGSLFTWKLWAPRIGVNVKLTGDGADRDAEHLRPGVPPDSALRARYHPSWDLVSDAGAVSAGNRHVRETSCR